MTDGHQDEKHGKILHYIPLMLALLPIPEGTESCEPKV